jgi:hypothetical protein
LIDYVKILFQNIDISRLYNLPFLDFTTDVNLKTGEPSIKKTAVYHYCKIIIYDSGVVLFTGSIHKLYNSLQGIKAPNYKAQKQYKGFNGNQFTINNIIEVRNHLEVLFNCGANQMIFQNIEFGINTTPDFNPQLFIKGLLFHHGNLFEYKYKEHFAQVMHQQYLLKIYNKSNQYGIDNHTLRIELKIIKTEFLKQTKIITFEDVTINTLNNAKELLLKSFEEVVYYDYTIKKKRLTRNKKQSLVNYSNPRYWLHILKPQYRDRHKKRLLEITRNNSDNLKAKIKEDIIQKCVIINRLSKGAKCVIINSSYIGLNVTQKNQQKTLKKCLVTGLNISMQKDSLLLSHTGIKYYNKTDTKVYNEIKRKYLSTKWVDADIETQIKELAHNIRNTYNNRNITQNRIYPANQFDLFDLKDCQGIS